MPLVRRSIPLVALWACLQGGAAMAQSGLDAWLGQPVTGARIIAGGRELQDPALLPLLDTRPGVPFEMSDVRRSLQALSALGRFDDIAVEVQETPAGLVVVYLVRLTRRIERVEFDGDRGLPDRRLRRALTDRHGATLQPQRAREMAATLEQALHDAGYLDARATHRIEPRSEISATLVFDLAAGPRYRVGDVQVGATPIEDPARLRQRLGLSAGALWDEPRLRTRVAREVGRLRDAGRYEARLDVSPRPRRDAALVDVTVALEAGPIVTLAFDGDPVPRANLDDLVPVKREGSADEDLLEDSKRRLERHLRAEGFRQARVDYRRSLDGDSLRIVFDVRRGPAFVVGAVDLRGVASLQPAEIDAVMALRPGRSFVESTLDEDAAAIAALYRSRGFAEARVTRTATPASGPGPERAVPVEVVLSIEEGPRTLVGSISIAGHAGLPEGDLRRVMQLQPGGPFFAPQLDADRAAVEALYLNRGYQGTSATAAVSLSDDRRFVNVFYRIAESRPTTLDHVIVSGNARTSTETILRELQLVRGQVIGLDALTAAQQRVTALGLFRRVRIDTLAGATSGVVDVLVTVEENAATSIGYGAGVEGGRQLRREDQTGNAVERLEFAPRGFFEVGRRNLWGKNRSVNLFGRASLRQTPGTEEDPDPGGFGIYEYRVLAAFREPRAFGWTADGSVSGVVEQAIRTSFSYRRRALNADLTRRIGRRLTAIARYSYGYTDVYEERYSEADKPLIDRLYPQVTLSTLAGVVAWDTRDDVIDPTRGTLLGFQTDVAARAYGSEVGFLKTFSQGFYFRQLPGTRLVLATGVRVGLATGFPRLVTRTDESGEPVLDAEGNPIVDTVRDLPASERFYAGGDTTVRGFTLDRLGDEATIDADGFPTGGDAVVIANAELRFPVTRTLGGVVFLDAGNVFARVVDLDLGRIRGAAGFGVRYKSPIGPLRFDLGFKLDPQTLRNGERERRYALHISVGQAF
jgi:outer membrane protein assembly factor BamA